MWPCLWWMRLSPQVLEECGRKGVKIAVIGSAGSNRVRKVKIQTQLAPSPSSKIRFAAPIVTALSTSSKGSLSATITRSLYRCPQDPSRLPLTAARCSVF
jgi:hypothetical protein